MSVLLPAPLAPTRPMMPGLEVEGQAVEGGHAARIVAGSGRGGR